MKKETPRRPRLPPPELSMDTVDAAGFFGLLAGALSIVLPYFDGLTLAMSALGAGAAVVRSGREPRPQGRQGSRVLWSGVAMTAAGMAVFLAAPPVLDQVRGLVLGTAAVPLWLAARQPLPFGGG